MPSNTYIATWLAASNVGATVVPVEPREDTFNIDPFLLDAAITSRTKAIIAVHLYGQTADMDPLLAIAEKRGIKVRHSLLLTKGLFPLSDSKQGDEVRVFPR